LPNFQADSISALGRITTDSIFTPNRTITDLTKRAKINNKIKRKSRVRKGRYGICPYAIGNNYADTGSIYKIGQNIA